MLLGVRPVVADWRGVKSADFPADCRRRVAPWSWWPGRTSLSLWATRRWRSPDGWCSPLSTYSQRSPRAPYSINFPPEKTLQKRAITVDATPDVFALLVSGMDAVDVCEPSPAPDSFVKNSELCLCRPQHRRSGSNSSVVGWGKMLWGVAAILVRLQKVKIRPPLALGLVSLHEERGAFADAFPPKRRRNTRGLCSLQLFMNYQVIVCVKLLFSS